MAEKIAVMSEAKIKETLLQRRSELEENTTIPSQIAVQSDDRSTDDLLRKAGDMEDV